MSTKPTSKTDLRTELATLYPTGKRATRPHLVDVPAGRFIMMDGSGDPNTSPRFEEVLGVLYPVAYGVKFASKAAGRDYVVMPLEGLWWSDDLTAFTLDRRDEWRWTLMIRHPNFVSESAIRSVLDEVVSAGKVSESLAGDLRIEMFAEGRAAQVLHIGPYETEGPVIARLHEFVAEQRLSLRGEHHEIYLGDPRRSAPEKLKTVLRHPVE